MSNKLIKFSVSAAAVIVFLAAIYLSGAYTQIARAASLSFSPTTCYSSVSTTTPVAMTPGAATTTITCVLGPDGANGASLFLQLTASSTSTVLVGQVEYSQDGIDWYQNNQDVYAAGAIAIATPSNSFTWTAASTTLNGVAMGDRMTKVVKISTPTSRVRVVLTLTGDKGLVWGQILPRQSVN